MTSTKHDEAEIEEVTADIMGPFELEPGLYFNRPNGLPIRINPYLAGNLARWHDPLQQPSFRRDLHAFVTEDVLTPALVEVFISIFSQPPGPTPSFPRSETYPVVLAHRRRLRWIRTVIATASGALHDRLGFGSPIHGLSTELVMKVLDIAQFDD